MTTLALPPVVSEDLQREAKESWMDPVLFFDKILVKPNSIFSNILTTTNVKQSREDEVRREERESEVEVDENKVEADENKVEVDENEIEVDKDGVVRHHESTDHDHKSRRPSMEGYNTLFETRNRTIEETDDDEEEEDALPPGIEKFPLEARHPSIHEGKRIDFEHDAVASHEITSGEYELDEDARRDAETASRAAVEASAFACARAVDAITVIARGAQIVEDESDIGVIRQYLASILARIEVERKRSRRLNAMSENVELAVDKLKPRVACIEMARDRVMKVLRRRKRRVFEKQGHLLQQLYGHSLQDPAYTDRQRREFGLAVVSNLSKLTDIRRDDVAETHRKSVEGLHADFFERMDRYVTPLLPFKDKWDVASWMGCSSSHLDHKCRTLRSMDESKAAGGASHLDDASGRTDDLIDRLTDLMHALHESTGRRRLRHRAGDGSKTASEGLLPKSLRSLLLLRPATDADADANIRRRTARLEVLHVSDEELPANVSALEIYTREYVRLLSQGGGHGAASTAPARYSPPHGHEGHRGF